MDNNKTYSIQIGCNHGQDDFYKFVKHSDRNTDCVIFVEPLSLFNERIQKQYTGLFDCLHLENVAIVGKQIYKPLRFYYCTKDTSSFNIVDMSEIGDPENYGCSSIHKELLLSHSFRGFKYAEEDVREIIVPSMTLTNLIDKYNVSCLVNLFIDAEGEDVNILTNFDIEKYMPLNINFEHRHADSSELDALVNRLTRLGYGLTWHYLSIHAQLNESNTR